MGFAIKCSLIVLRQLYNKLALRSLLTYRPLYRLFCSLGSVGKIGTNSQRGKRREGLESKGKREGGRGDHFSFSLFGLGFRVSTANYPRPQMIPVCGRGSFAILYSSQELKAIRSERM